MSGNQLDLDHYRLFRSRVVEEDGLINHRMNWLLWTSAILLAFWGATVVAALKRDEFPDARVRGALLGAGVIVALAGWAVAVISAISIAAARKEVENLRDDYAKHIGQTVVPLAVFRSVTGEAVKHLRGHWSAKLIPWIFIVVWPLLVLISYYAFDYAVHGTESLRAVAR